MDLFSAIILLAIYTVVVLIFVPLDKIGKWQDKVRKQWQKLLDKSKQ